MENINKLKPYFESGKTKSSQFRIETLKQLKQVIKENEELLLTSLQQDLGKNDYEGLSQELMLVYDEINFGIKHLKKASRNQSKSTSIIHFPARSKVIRKPYGTVLVISPWNYPLMLSLVPIIGAIATGNCCVLVPSSKATACENALKQILGNFNPDLIQVITGSGSQVVPHIFANYPIDYVFFTGGETVGKKVAAYAAEGLIPYTLELGGKSPCVVTESADLKVAARKIVWGKFINSSQVCVAPDYLIVDAKIKDSLIPLLIAEIEKLFTPESYGKIIDESSILSLAALIKNEKVLYGGNYNLENRYFQPTLVEVENLATDLMTREIFGPIFPIVTTSEFTQVFEIIANNPTPLASYIYTNDRKEQNQFQTRLQTGAIAINDNVIQISNNSLPFGGIGTSGNGAYHGKYSFECFTYPQAVLTSTTKFDLNIKYPPYTPFKRWLLKVALDLKR